MAGTDILPGAQQHRHLRNTLFGFAKSAPGDAVCCRWKSKESFLNSAAQSYSIMLSKSSASSADPLASLAGSGAKSTVTDLNKSCSSGEAPPLLHSEVPAAKHRKFTSYHWKMLATGRGVTRGHNSPGAEKSQQCHKYFRQNSTFASERTQVRTWGRQTCSMPRAPCNLGTPLAAGPRLASAQNLCEHKNTHGAILG